MVYSIKGLQYKAFDKNIQKGIFLHRQIVTSTDAHPNFKSSTKRLHANYGHYSGIIVDIFYDHFLAKNWNDYSSQSLIKFADKNYRLFQKNFKRLTP